MGGDFHVDATVAVTPFTLDLSDSVFPSGVSHLLSEQVKLRPANPAMFYGDKVVTYGELEARVSATAIALYEAGIRSGDKVGVFFPNHPDFVVAFFAVVRIGATVVPINPLLKADEIAHILADSDSKAVIVHELLLPELETSLNRLQSLETVFVMSYQGKGTISDAAGKKVNILDDSELAGKAKSPDMQAKQIAEHGVLIQKEQLAVLVYTSGTTGKPKGAMLSHGNLLAAVTMKKAILKFTETDRVLAVLPLCHIYGLAVVVLGMISQGGAMVIVEKFEPIPVLKEIQDKRVTVLPAVPAMYQFMAMELEKNSYDISSLRFCVSGAAPLDAELLKRLDTVFGAPILEGYALTETACIATITPIEGPRKPGSVGPKVPGVELYVVDNKLRPLPHDKSCVGQIAVRGPNVMSGYYKQPEATEECIKDGLFLTGDLGYFDPDGYLHISGRTKELIIRGGQNIYPREVEAAIMKMESILDVGVVGVPDKYMGERVKAVVVVRPGYTVTDEDVKDFCSQRLAPYKVPRLVEFRDILPRNSTGKILKRLLV